MSIANDFMDIDFDDAADADVDIDIGLVDSDLDIMGCDPVLDSDEEIEKKRNKNRNDSQKIVPDKVYLSIYNFVSGKVSL